MNAASAKAAKGSPARIRSDIIDIKRKSQTVNFLGNVVVEKDDASLLADKMTVLYNEKEEGKSAEEKASIQRIDATSNVKIFNDEFVATGEIGYYEPDKDTFTLERNVIVNNGSSIATGDKFIYDLKVKKGKFVGKKEDTKIEGDKRVTITIGNDLKDYKKHDKNSKR